MLHGIDLVQAIISSDTVKKNTIHPYVVNYRSIGTLQVMELYTADVFPLESSRLHELQVSCPLIARYNIASLLF